MGGSVSFVDGHIDDGEPTPGDHIRSMPDKELAELLTIGTGGFFCFECMQITGNNCDGCCTEHCEEWLGKPMKESGSDATD